MKPRRNEAKTDYLKRCTDDAVKQGHGRRDAYASCNATYDATTGRLHVRAPLTLAGEKLSADGDARTFLVTAKSGKPVKLPYYWLAIDMSGIRTEPKMPVLRQHDPSRVVGYGQAYKDGDNLYVEGEFSRITKDGLEVVQLADEGFPWQASIGIWADQVKNLGPRETATVNGREVKGPAIIYQKSHVREVSFVALGADQDTAAIAFSADAGAAMPETSDDMVGQVRELMAGGMDWFNAMATWETENGKIEHNQKNQKGGDAPMENKLSADRELAMAAQRLAYERNIPLVQALREVVRMRPELRKRWVGEILAASGH